MVTMFVIFSVQLGRSIERHFIEQDLGELQAIATSLNEALVGSSENDEPQALDSRLARAVAGHHGVYFDVRDSDGRQRYSTAPGDLLAFTRDAPAASRLDEASLRVWSVSARTYRGTVLQMRGYTVLVAVSTDSDLQYLARLRRVLWWSTLAACAVAILAAWLAVKWGHAPMRRISNTVRGITSEQLHVRLQPAEVPVELTHLVASFNLMLDRLQESFERLSHFSVDIAHELRTPVTNLTTQTEVALSKPRTTEAYREVLYSNLEELERMGKMIGDMLFLAHADHPLAKPEMAEIDLCAEVQALFDYFEAWAEEVRVRLALEGSAPSVHGDRLMLRRALSNLISNALRYAPEHSTLTVRLAQTAAAVDVSVENFGPDIAAEHLPKLFDRFYRADLSRQHKGEGAGLGLAIVKSIVEAHHGTVTARSDAGTTCFTVRLPIEATA